MSLLSRSDSTVTAVCSAYDRDVHMKHVKLTRCPSTGRPGVLTARPKQKTGQLKQTHATQMKINQRILKVVEINVEIKFFFSVMLTDRMGKRPEEHGQK